MKIKELKQIIFRKEVLISLSIIFMLGIAVGYSINISEILEEFCYTVVGC